MAEPRRFTSLLFLGLLWFVLTSVCAGLVVELWFDAADGVIVNRTRSGVSVYSMGVDPARFHQNVRLGYLMPLVTWGASTFVLGAVAAGVVAGRQWGAMQRRGS